MKMKLNLDKNSLKTFALEHSEKFVLGVVILGFVALIAGAVQQDRYESEPETLDGMVTRAEGVIADAKPDPQRVARDYRQMIENSRPPREEDYQHQAPWNPRLQNPMELPGQPPILPVRELRAVADRGPFRMKEPVRTNPRTRGQLGGELGPGGAMPFGGSGRPGIRGQRWVVLTGLVPLEDQQRAWDEYFADKFNPTGQYYMPDYIYYRIERAEVPEGNPAARDLQWQRLNVRKAMQVVQRWEGTATEVVDRWFTHQILTFPLGPLVDEDRNTQRVAFMDVGGPRGRDGKQSVWDAEQVAHPEIPLAEPEDPRGLRGRSDEMADDELMTDDPTADVPGGGFGVRGRGFTGPGGIGGPEMFGPPMTRERRPTGQTGARRPTSRRPPGIGPGAGLVPGGMPGGLGAAGGRGQGYEQQQPEYVLFRFFDFDAEPGKSYRYRVRLLLANPLEGVDPKYLAPDASDLAEKRWLENDQWSEPTGVVTMPRDAHLLALGVSRLNRELAEPTGKVAIVKWNKNDGQEVMKEFSASRGQPLNYMDVRVEPPKQDDRDRLDRDEGPMPPMMGPMAEREGGRRSRYDDRNDRRTRDDDRRGRTAERDPRRRRADDRDERRRGDEDRPPGPLGIDMFGGPPTARQERDEPETVDFVTGCVVVDMSGGDRMPGSDRSLTEPGHILVMDRDGSLMLLNEFEDKPEYERRQAEAEAALEEDDDPRRPGGMGPGGFDPMQLFRGG